MTREVARCRVQTLKTRNYSASVIVHCTNVISTLLHIYVRIKYARKLTIQRLIFSSNQIQLLPRISPLNIDLSIAETFHFKQLQLTIS